MFKGYLFNKFARTEEYLMLKKYTEDTIKNGKEYLQNGK